MKCYSKKIQTKQGELADRENKLAHEEYLASLTEDERIAYYEKQRENSKKISKTLASLFATSSILGGGMGQSDSGDPYLEMMDMNPDHKNIIK